MTLLLVRHGESEGNASRIIQGSLDAPLSALGRAQAEATARRLAREPVAAVYASTLARAFDTGAIIAATHGLEPQGIDDLREYHYGEAQGLSREEIYRRWPRALAEWGAGHVPGEEGAARFRERVAAAFDALAARHRDDLAVVAIHGGTIVQVIAHVLGLPPGGRVRSAVANCAITTIATAGGAPTIVALNDECHLRGAVAAFTTAD